MHLTLPTVAAPFLQVARAADLGRNDRVLFTRTHLGGILHPGDTALGFDLEHGNYTDPDLDRFLSRGGSMPDVILVGTANPGVPSVVPRRVSLMADWRLPGLPAASAHMSQEVEQLASFASLLSR